ncbi:MAG: hypothetical protein QG629_297 [Patescibacteria group bacterium]|nr:hypothetical protein [Candidatus Saccharibacteria bacterium]MDQ5963215.1 hypothetical protein [Patescibacteria group bacterium]
MNLSLDQESIRKQLRQLEAIFNTYKAILLFLALALLYGFITLRISLLSNIQPSQTEIANVQKAAKPKVIPPKTIEKLKALEGSNDRTQSIFNEARSNPFKE